MTTRRLPAMLVVAMALALTVPAAAHAHALLDRAVPAVGGVVPDDGLTRRLTLDFTEAVTLGPGAVVVLDAAQGRVGPIVARLATPSRVEVDLPALAAGAYAVRWRVTSADSHVVRGVSWFVVGFAPAPPPAITLRGTGAPAIPGLEVAARWLGLIAVIGLAGAVLFEWLVLRRTGAPPSAVATAGPPAPVLLAIVLVAGEMLRAAAQAASVADLPVLAALDRATLKEVLAGSRFAVWWWLRLAGGLAIAARLARRPDGQRLPPDTLAAGAVLLVATAAAGHALSGRAPLVVTLAADVAHLAAAALWLGGLAHVGVWLARRVRDPARRAEHLADVVPRLSAAALASVLVLLGTGAVSAYAQVGSLALLTRSAYGEALLLKLALVVPWLALAAVNRFALRARLASAGALFTSLVRAETIVGLAVLLVVGLLGSLPPPAARPLPAMVDVARQAGPLRVSLRVEPAWVGISRFAVTLTDAAGAPPLDVERVVVTFTMDGMNMGRTHVTLTPRGAGAWETRGFYVGMPGVSQIGVAVARNGAPDTSAVFRVEIPDVNAAQLAGLRGPAGVGAPGIFGVVMTVCLVLAVVVAERGVRRRVLPVAAAAVVVLGVGPVAGDRFLRARADVEDARGADAGAARVARGADVYARQCAICHGATGNGNGAAASSLLPPPSDLTVHARWHGDDQLFWFVTHGVTGTAMIGFRDRLGPRERWDAVAYLHALAAAPTATALRVAGAEGRAAAASAPAASTQPASPVPAPRTASAPSSASPTPGVRSTPRASSPPSSGAAAPATPSGPVGRLVYGPDFDNNLWLMSLPAGTVTALTRLGPLEFASNPAWSPDGTRIAFSHYRLPGGDAIPVPDGTDLGVMGATGGVMRVLAAHDVRGAALQYPAWSADGKSVYVGSTGPGGAALGIDRVDAVSGARVRVVAGAEFPTLSRDGRRLAYVRFAPPPERGQSLWWSAPDGSGAREVVAANTFDKLFAPRFSPDGRRLLFAAVGQPTSAPRARRLDPLRLLARTLGVSAAVANGDVWDLWTVEVEGRGLQAVTALGEDLPVGAWSPDGRYLAFLGGGSVRTAEAGITVLGADGTPWRRLTAQPGHRGLDWARP